MMPPSPRAILSLTIVAFVVASAAAQTPTPVSSPEGHVTFLVHDVQLLPEQADARPAALNDKVDEGTALRTGEDSRSELTFADLTITRLGANTIFSFNKAGRSIRLESGSILVYARKNSGAAEVVTKAVSVGVTGTTIIVESDPTAHDRLIVLEGRARFTLNTYPSQTTELGRGQVLNVRAGAKKLPKPGRVDLRRIVNTHPLIKNFPPLPSLDLILASTQKPNAPPPPPPTGASGGSVVSQPPYAPSPIGPTYGGPNQPFTPRPAATPQPTVTPRPKPRPTAKPTPRPTPRPTPKRPISGGTGSTIGKRPVRKQSTPTPTPVQIR